MLGRFIIRSCSALISFSAAISASLRHAHRRRRRHLLQFLDEFSLVLKDFSVKVEQLNLGRQIIATTVAVVSTRCECALGNALIYRSTPRRLELDAFQPQDGVDNKITATRSALAKLADFMDVFRK